ncbi:MAG: O-antigen ligase family protein [Roseicyclus sp.]
MTSRFQMVEYAIAYVGLLFMSGALNTFLAPQAATSAPLVQAMGAALGLYSILGLLAMRNATGRIFGLYWFALIPVVVAAASMGWTDNLSLSFRRSAGLGLSTAFALWLALRFTPKQLLGLVVVMAATVIAASFVVVMAAPSRGIHQAYDLFAEHHAGSWRGLFGHKNDFGRVASFAASLLMIGFVFRVGGPRLRWGTLALVVLAVFMISKSNSSQAILLVATVPASVLVLLSMRTMMPMTRTVVLISILPIVVIGVLSAQLIFEYVLGALGRDATLTGRTEIWEGVILALEGNMALGGGFGAGWEKVRPTIAALTGIDVGHAHNGFLDLAVDIGFVGLALTLTFLFSVGVMAFRSLMRGIQPEISTMALAVVIFSLIGNFAGSFLLLHNSIYWVLTVVAFVQLRDARLGYTPAFTSRRTAAYQSSRWHAA